MKRVLLIFSLLAIISCTKDDNILSGPNNPSTGILESAKTYGGTKNDVAQSVIATSDGGFAVAGYTQSMDGDVTGKSNESFDFWLLKFDANANLLWNKTYGGTDDDRARALIQTQDGGFAILGYAVSSDGDVTGNNGFRDFWLIKTDAQGNLSWQKSFGFSGADEGTTLIETSDNHLLIAGVLDVSASGGLGNSGRANNRHAGGDYWAIKVSQAGNMVWSRYFGGSFTDTPTGVVETTNNQFFIVGSSDSNDVDITNNKGTYDFWAVRAAASGDMVWEKSYGGNEIDEARGIVSSGDGNYVIVGDTRSSDQDVTMNNGAADLWLVKVDDNGSILWNQSFGGSGFDVPRSIRSTNDGGFIISGSSRSSDGDVANNQGQNDAWIVKVNSSGQLVWQQTVGGTEIDFAYDAVELNNGSIIAVGESSSGNGDLSENKGFTDLLIIKLN